MSSNGRSRKALAIQFMKFNAVGLLNTAIDMILYTLLVWLGVHFAIAQVLSYGAGMANSYVLNSKFTFGGTGTSSTSDKSGSLRMGARFVVWNGVILAVSILFLTLMTTLAGMNELYAKLIATAVTVVINFYGSKRWVFAGARAN
ncbi:GtrA family protein [Paenibacillus harenae]|uniref:GtrA family protein n=1 Tax=Paenibacillus harenae TaxID=306543 RepID=UPI00278C9F37|nr:GtrA family protein [Paenibacillus harenae]MDQ0058855.1 putative flippase GtrA [Paenibacillus harenae]